MEEKNQKIVTVRLTLEQYTALSELAEASCRTISGHIRQIIRRYLDYPNLWNL